MRFDELARRVHRARVDTAKRNGHAELVRSADELFPVHDQGLSRFHRGGGHAGFLEGRQGVEAEDREVDDRRRVDVGHVHRQGYRREG